MITVIVPPLAPEMHRMVRAVIMKARRYDPAWFATMIELRVDPDAVCVSIDGADELAGALLLARINHIIQGDDP